ncbi:uncharacterized protein LOC116620085 [Nematostella vectensis]|uniref:uncharacterized protein LOC116620085 n=1 Tax=Nematostella vectensis TaxID=45351 RepID=UPI002077162E|nr:uncharacterized protein LOC116620085 [Nematostella vectensis]
MVYLIVHLANLWLTCGRWPLFVDLSCISGRHLENRNDATSSRVTYSSAVLKSIGKTQPKVRVPEDLWETLHDLGIRKGFRSKRAGRCRYIGSGTPVATGPLTEEVVLSVPSPIGVAHNGVDIACITESWLTPDVPDPQLNNFTIFRKDRVYSSGGGVAVYVNSDIPCKEVNSPELVDCVSELLWLQLRPVRLPRSVSSILLGVIYHPPRASTDDNTKLYEHIQSVVDPYMSKHPDCLVWVVGDFNPTFTKILPSVFKCSCGLSQIVDVLTRDTGILDWCLTNQPKLPGKPVQLPKLGNSDHYCILIRQGPCRKPPKKTIERRDMRDNRIREFGRWLTAHSWDELFLMTSGKEKFELFHSTLTEAFNKQRAFSRGGKGSPAFHLWRNKVQRLIKSCKRTFYERKVEALKESNISRWWKEVKALSGGSCRNGKWYDQLLVTSDSDPIESLCNRMNSFFVGLTYDLPPLTTRDVASFQVDEVPARLLATIPEVERALSASKVKKAPGPDGIPNTILKTFSFELAPVICDLYNSSLTDGFFPSPLKSAIARPLPKSKHAKTVENDVRLISLTSQVAKIMEGLTLSRMLPAVLDKIDSKQFAVASKSTEQAIVYILHLMLEALDLGNCSVRLFFADFRKAFDLIDHHILLDKLRSLYVETALLRLVAAFLQGRSQSVCLDGKTSSSQLLNGGIPQGTRLGPIFFCVMVNDLVGTWPPRAKFVDDLTVLEVVPRNSPSLLGHIVNDIQAYALKNNMRLNPSKCKEMSVSFLNYDSCSWQPMAVGGNTIDRVQSFKLLGVLISCDLTWVAHCDFIIKKANKRLRVLKKSGLDAIKLITVYRSLIRSVIEYASASLCEPSKLSV